MFNITIKQIMKVIGVFFVITLLLNIFTIVDATQTKVQVCFGKVNENSIYSEGIHWVNPFCSFDTMFTAEQKYEVNGLSIPTQDRFNSSANVTVLFKIPAGKVIDIRKQYGGEKVFIETSLRQHLRSVIRDEGRKLEDSRSLGQSSNVSDMQENTTARLSEILFSRGMDISQVLVQDIDFDERIAKQILDAQVRIQNEESQASQTRVAKQLANQKRETQKGISDAAKLVTDAQNYATRNGADAAEYDTRKRADAKRYAIEQEAAANILLAKSRTPEIREKQKLDNEALLYSRSTGAMPHTVIGDTDLRAYGIPVVPNK